MCRARQTQLGEAAAGLGVTHSDQVGEWRSPGSPGTDPHPHRGSRARRHRWSVCASTGARAEPSRAQKTRIRLGFREEWDRHSELTKYLGHEFRGPIAAKNEPGRQLIKRNMRKT